MADLSGGTSAQQPQQGTGAIPPIDPNLSVNDIPLYGDPAFNAFMAKSGYSGTYLNQLAQQKAGNLNNALQASLGYQDQTNQRTQGEAASGQAARGMANSSQYLGQQAAIQGQEAAQRANAIYGTANQISDVHQNLVNQIISQNQQAAQGGVDSTIKAVGPTTTPTTTYSSGGVSQ